MTATHTHNFRCPDDLWAAAKVAVAVEGRTVTDVIVAALRRLVAGPRQEFYPASDDDAWQEFYLASDAAAELACHLARKPRSHG